MKKSLIWMVLFLFSSLFVAACGGGGSSSSTSTGSTPANLHIINSSTHTIDLLEAAPSSSPTWDYQYYTVLAPGGTHDFTSLPPNTYDFCAISSNYEACTWGFNLASGATVTFTIHGADFGGALAVVNHNANSITSIRLKMTTETMWWPNVLGSPLTQNSTVWVNYLDAGSWDVEMVSNTTTTATYTITSYATYTLNVP
jgi:hypothetical protein